MNLRVDSLKTGTPPRIDARTINFDILAKQHGDEVLPVFSFMGSVDDHPQQIPCYITHTNEQTHEVIRNNLDRSPMYTGVIEGIGPRYCPSIEDKVMRFADRNSHQIYLEPEGLTSNEVYPNGISTSLPFDVQMGIVNSMKGLEKARIVKPGYAIEYDYFDPRDLKPTLETKAIQVYSLRVKLTVQPVMKKQRHKAYWLGLTQVFMYKRKKHGIHVAINLIQVY